MQARDLDKVARNELKSLSKDNADWVAKHLVMASRLIDDDPELAHLHALSAARRAGRIAVVRETLAITAYETGDYALALRELRTFRRISGSDEQLPLMVDSERGVGRPEKALELGRSVDRSTLTPATQVSLAIAMSGARLDLGSPELALGELEIPQLDPDHAYSYSPALYDAYAEVLSELGRVEDAALWRRRASVALHLLGGPDESETIEIVEEEFDVEEIGSDDLASEGLGSVGLDSEALDLEEAEVGALGGASPEGSDTGSAGYVDDASGDDPEVDELADVVGSVETDEAAEFDGSTQSGDSTQSGRPAEEVEADGSADVDDLDELAADDTQKEDGNGTVRPQED